MLVPRLILWIIAIAITILECKTCIVDRQGRFKSCLLQFEDMEKGSTFWADICSDEGLNVLDCLIEETTACPQLWTDTDLGNLSYLRDLVKTVSPTDDSYAVNCERNTKCKVAYDCFMSVFRQSDSTSALYTGLTEFYLWLCGNEYGVTYILDCFIPAEDLCQATIDHLRRFRVIEYSNGDALTFHQLSEMSTTECNDIGVVVTQCDDTGTCLTTLRRSAEFITSCLNNNASQCLVEPVIDFGQNRLQCDYSDASSQCIQDGCGPAAPGFFIRMFEFLKCGAKTNTACPAQTVTVQVGQTGYEILTQVDYPATLPGRAVEKNCPVEYEGVIRRRCSSVGAWETVAESCVKDILKDIRQVIDSLKNSDKVDSVKFQSVLDDLTEVTNPERNKTDKPPVKEVKDVINDVADLFTKKEETTEQEFKSFLAVVSNTVDKTNEEEWIKEGGRGGSSVMRDVDRTINKRLKSVGCRNIESKKQNLDVTVGMSSADIKYNPGAGANGINILKDALQQQGEVCYGGVHYKTIAPILPRQLVRNGLTQKLNDNMVVNTDVMSLQLEEIIRNMEPPAELTFALLEKGLRDPVCVSWNFSAPSADGNGAWTSDGCDFEQYSNSGDVICRCSHLTNFAVLMSTSKTSDDHVKVLSIISAVGCAVSIIALILTIIFHLIVWRFVRSDRSIILMNLCVALLIALIAFLAGISRTESEEACKAIAAVLHFLFLAVFFLMLTQGIEIMVCVIHVFTTKFRLKLLLPVAWLSPAVIVGISLGVTKTNGYGNKDFCWLSTESGLIWAFIGPAAVVIIVNIVVIIVVFKKLISSHAMRDKSRKEKTKSSLRSICVLLPLLGCTWAFGILSINNDTVVFQYIFCVLNSLQGLFIFLFHCVFNNQLRDVLKKQNAKRRSLATFESDLKKRSANDSLGQEASAAYTDKSSNDSRKKTKLHRHDASAKKYEMNGLDEWQKEQRRKYQRQVRRQISDNLDWTDSGAGQTDS